MRTEAPTKTLFRPVGLKELELIHRANMRAFPPRLPEQPIFYPVLAQEYAAQIARDWNTKDRASGHVGFVLRFHVHEEYLRQFDVQVVGGRQHQELWIPAERLGEFNGQIVGEIEVLEAFQGEGVDLDLEPATLIPRAWLLRKSRAEEIVFTGKHCEVRRVDGWEYVARRRVTGVVAVLAITSERKILLVEQFRIPLDRNVIELPAGLAGDVTDAEHEAFAEAAHRELIEETGYRADGFEFLGEGPSSAGLTNEVISFFRAHQLTKIGAGGVDGSENITVHEVPIDSLTEWLAVRRGEGCLVDYKINAALDMARGRP